MPAVAGAEAAGDAARAAPFAEVADAATTDGQADHGEAADRARGDDGETLPSRRSVGARRATLAAAALVLLAVLGVAAAQLTAPAPHDPVAGTAMAHSGLTDTVAPGALVRQLWERPVASPAELGAPDDIWIGGLAHDHIRLHTPAGRLFVPRGDGPMAVPTGNGGHRWAPRGLSLDPAEPQYLLGGGLLLTVDRHGSVVASAPLDAQLHDADTEAWPLGDDRLLATTADSVLVLGRDGTTIWRHEVDLVEPYRGWGVDLLDVGARELIVRTGIEVVALDPVTGALRWSATVGGPAPDPPLVTDELVLVGGDGSVAARARTDGRIRWERRDVPLGGRWLGEHDGVLLGVAGSGGGTELWLVDAHDGHVRDVLSTPIGEPWDVWLIDGILVGRSVDGRAVAMTLDGDTAWEFPARRVQVVTDPRDGAEVAAVATGTEILLVEPRTGRVRETQQLATAVLEPHPQPALALALHGRMLFVPAATGAAVPAGFVDLVTGEPIASPQLRDDSWDVAPHITRSLLGVRGATGDLQLYRADGSQLDDAPRGLFELLGELPAGVVALGADRGAGPRPLLLDPATGAPVAEPSETDDSPLADDEQRWPHLSPGVAAGPDLLLAQAWDPIRGHQQLVAFEAVDGQVVRRWQVGTGHGSLHADDRHAVTISHAAARIRDLADGSVTGTVVLPRLPQATAFADGVLLAVAGDRLDGIPVAEPSRAWHVSLPVRATSAPIVAGDEVLVGLQDGRLARFGLDGRPRGTTTLDDVAIRDLFAAHGIVVATTDDRVVAWGPADLPELDAGSRPRVGRVDLP